MQLLERFAKGTFISIRLKIIFYLTIIFTPLFAGIFYFFYKISTDFAQENLYSNLMDVATYAAEGINGDLHQALYENPEYNSNQEWPNGMIDSRYWQIAEWLYTVHRSNQDAYLYTYVSPGPGQVEFVVSMGPLLQPVIGAHFRELYIPKPPSVILDGLSGETLSKNIVTDKWGSWVSGFVPIHDSTGQIVAALGVDFKADILMEIQNRLKMLFIPIFIVSYLVLMGFVVLISNQVTIPMISLAKSATLIGEGKNIDANSRNGFFRDELSMLEEIIVDMGNKVRTREEKLISLTEQLHHFYQASIEYRENENNALALNIHDEILGQLAVISMEVNISDNERFDTQFQELANRIRRMMSSLRPVMLNYGLWLVLEEYVEECSNRHGFESTVQLDLPFSDTRFDTKTEEHIFRIVQQACENAMRHANATTIIIDGMIDHNKINIVVDDDGEGLRFNNLDFNSLLSEGHFGLASMFERASLIGANLNIISDPGQGTQIVIDWEESDE